MNAVEIPTRVRNLAQLEPNVDVLWLYGSRAKGTEPHNSDFDLAVASYPFPEDRWDLRLQPELLAQSWSDQLNLFDGIISIADINHIPIQLALSIIQTSKVLTVKDTIRLIRKEHQITSIWEVDHLYHRSHDG